jgi:spermidine/putrescine transport system ATP-binding protein
MNEGRVEQIGSPQDIYHSPASVFVANFIGSANLMRATVAEVRGDRATAVIARDHKVEMPSGDWGAKAGGAATVMVRPERLRLTGNGQAERGALPTTVQSVVFQGPVVRCALRCADGTIIVAHVGPEHELPDVRTGQTIYVSWDPDAARLLPPGDAKPGDIDIDDRTTVERAIPTL